MYVAAVILNLLTAVALLATYGATLREAPRPEPRPGLTGGAAGAPGRGQTWTVQGIVRGTLDDGRLVVTHEEIPGLMPGMTMAFALPRGSAPRGLRAGDRVVLTLGVSSGELTVMALDRTERVGDATEDPR